MFIIYNLRLRLRACAIYRCMRLWYGLLFALRNTDRENEVKKLQEKMQTKETNANKRRFLCPVCGKHTVLWLLPTTQIRDLPVKCKRCGEESIVNISPEPAP